LGAAHCLHQIDLDAKVAQGDEGVGPEDGFHGKFEYWEENITLNLRQGI